MGIIKIFIIIKNFKLKIWKKIGPYPCPTLASKPLVLPVDEGGMGVTGVLRIWKTRV